MTTKELNEIKRLNAEGKSDRQIIEETGLEPWKVRQARRRYNLRYNKGKKKPCRHYTVWNARTDELVAVGTAEECASLMDRADFHTMVSRVRSGRNKKYVVLVENYDD